MKLIFATLNQIQEYVPHILLRKVKKYFQIKSLPGWKKNGCQVPPPHIIKVYLLKFIAKKKKLVYFVETGTFRGDMIDEMKSLFKKIYSIELFEPLYVKAKKIFKKYKHINIIQGNSSKILPAIISRLNEPTLFWLDAHFSGSGTAQSSIDTPIEKELEIITKIMIQHVIVIDDARLFIGKKDYPNISKLIQKYKNSYTITIIHDMIVLVK